VKEILLTKGYVARVSDKKYTEVMRGPKWCAQEIRDKKGNLWAVYAVRTFWNAEKSTREYMHRFILGVTDRKIKVDHKDGDGLNNQTRNLRISTDKQNQGNSKKQKNRSSKYKGVTFAKTYGKWQVSIMKDGRLKALGRFAGEEDAARAYDTAARVVFGKFACVNFPTASERSALI
jgi:hypothetical protein